MPIELRIATAIMERAAIEYASDRVNISKSANEIRQRFKDFMPINLGEQ